MANNIENVKSQITEQLFQAIDTITSKRLEKLEFDKTLTCQIIDNSNASFGEYIVSDGITEFTAYSENDSYAEDTWVYVSVPNGDFDQQKHIVGKYIADNTEYSTYRNPLDRYIDITGNLIDQEISQEFGLLANDSKQSEIVIWRTGDMSLNPYSSDAMNAQEYLELLQYAINNIERQYLEAIEYLKSLYTEDSEEYQTQFAELQTLHDESINELNIQKAEIDVLDNTTSLETRTLSNFNRLGVQASFKSLLGKYHLNTGTYGLRLDIVTVNPGSTSAVKTYDYTSLKMDINSMFGDPYNFITWSQQQYVFDISDFDDIVGMQLVFFQSNDFTDETGKLIPGYEKGTIEWTAYEAMKNIFVKDIYISLGYELSEFTQDTLLLYSFEPLTYSSYLTQPAREILEAKNEDLPIEEKLNLNTEAGIAEGLRIVNEKNLHLRWIHVDDEEGSIEAIDEIEDLGTWEDDINNEEKFLAKVHWYHWKLEDGVEDELAGAFWEEINLNAPEENYYDFFDWEGFNPNPMAANEKVKVVVEYPSREFLEYQYQDSVDEYLESITEELRAGVIEELYPGDTAITTYDDTNLLHRTTVSTALKVKLDIEKESYHVATLGECMLYSSPELVLTNEHEVPNQASIDLVRGLKLVCDEDGYNGIYRIYNADGKIINSGEANRARIISAQFDTLVTGDKTLDSAEKIKWFFPIRNTMIEYPVDGCEYDSTKTNEIAGLDESGEWFSIERQGVQVSTGRAAGEIVPTELEQIFRIKDYYTQTAINNTIRCEVYKNNKTYSAEYILYFGSSGSNGTDYTLTVSYEQYDIDTETWRNIAGPVLYYQDSYIRLVPHVFDYENKEITSNYEDSDFNFSLFSSSLLEGTEGLYYDQVGKTFVLHSTNNSNKERYFHYIIEVMVQRAVTVKSTNTSNSNTIDSNDVATGLQVNLTTYCPITVSFDNSIISMDGDSRITYSPTGTNPIYYKGEYTLYDVIDSKFHKIEGVTWSINLGTDEGADVEQYYPQIDAITGELIVPAMYMSGNTPTVSIIAQKNGSILWCQPLYISQDVYASAMMNAWDGSLSIDEQNGTIMSAMVGAGYKDNANRFNGVLMGNVGKKIGVGSSNTETGLFGYHEGQQSFGFKINGTAFLGKSGHGQIQFDGNSGQIKSANYSVYGSGMRIDLDDAYMDFRGAWGSQVHIGVNGGNGDNSYFKITDNYGAILLEFSDSNQMIQSADFSNGSGVKFDLDDGILTAYDFTLNAINGTGILLSSGGNPYIQVVGEYNDLLYISDSEFFMQSDDFDEDEETGTYFDLKNGQIISYNFNITAQKYGDNSKYIRINSEADTYPLIIGYGSEDGSEFYQDSETGRGDFAVGWDGSVYATNGSIGGWIMTYQGLFSDAAPTSSTFKGVALWNKNSDGTQDDPLRISVGKVSTNPTYYIIRIVSESDTDGEGDEIDSEASEVEEWVEVSKEQYNNWSGDKQIEYDPDSTSSTGFYVTKAGKLYAKNPSFSGIKFSSTKANNLSISNCKITKTLYYKGKQYTARAKTVVTGWDKATVTVPYFELSSNIETKSVPVPDSNVHVSAWLEWSDDDPPVPSAKASGYASPVSVEFPTYKLTKRDEVYNIKFTNLKKHKIYYLGRKTVEVTT